MGFFKDRKDEESLTTNGLEQEEEKLTEVQKREYDSVSDVLINQDNANAITEDDSESEMNIDDFDASIVDDELLDSLFADDEMTANIVEEKQIINTFDKEPTDDVTIISKGTTIHGNVVSDCNLDVIGTIHGDIECLGKLSVTGKVIGNSIASEVFVDADRLEGSINSEGSVEIAQGTVIIGDINASCAIIAGAVKGQIDITGSVIIDSTAIIKGNIKAKSIQVNNGAIIEGFCSLSYASVDIDNIFE